MNMNLEKVANLLEKLAVYIEVDESTKRTIVENNKTATARQVAAKVVEVLGDRIDEKTASNLLQDNETALQLLNQMNEKVAELGGPAPSMRSPKEAAATKPSPREEAKQADIDFAAWALGE